MHAAQNPTPDTCERDKSDSSILPLREWFGSYVRITLLKNHFNTLKVWDTSGCIIYLSKPGLLVQAIYSMKLAKISTFVLVHGCLCCWYVNTDRPLVRRTSQNPLPAPPGPTGIYAGLPGKSSQRAAKPAFQCQAYCVTKFMTVNLEHTQFRSPSPRASNDLSIICNCACLFLKIIDSKPSLWPRPLNCLKYRSKSSQ